MDEYNKNIIDKWLSKHGDPNIQREVEKDLELEHYRHISNKENYTLLLNSGMFWEVHPELYGDWDKDKVLIAIKLGMKHEP